MKVWFLQLDSKIGKISNNLSKLEQYLQKNKADLFVLPELFTTGYMFKDKEELKKYCENIPNWPTTNKLISLCKKYDMYLLVWLAEIQNGKLFDTTILVWPNGFIWKNQKKHLFYKENLIFDKWENAYVVYKTPIWNIGLMVCFDFMFPEVYRALALQWADILCITCCLKTPAYKVMTMARAWALQNWVYTLTVNRVGKERGVKFTGSSEIVWPRMEILAKWKKDEEDCKIVSIDINRAKDKGYNEYNNLLEDRRTNFYQL